MLARTAATHASSEFFAGMPADNSPFGIRPTKPSPLNALDQDEGYFDMIMRVRKHRPPSSPRFGLFPRPIDANRLASQHSPRS